MEALARRVRNLYGRELRNVPSDGDCQFHAVAHQIRHLRSAGSLHVSYIYEDHTALRRRCVRYIAEDPDLASFAKETGSSLALMALSGTFGGELTLHAMARMLGVCIQVVQPEWLVKIQEGSTLPIIILAHLPEHHYLSTVPATPVAAAAVPGVRPLRTRSINRVKSIKSTRKSPIRWMTRRSQCLRWYSPRR